MSDCFSGEETGAYGLGYDIDYTDAINEAINYAAMLGKRRVILKRGNYGISGRIVLKSGVTLEGGGCGPLFSSATIDDTDIMGESRTYIRAMSGWETGNEMIRVSPDAGAKYPIHGSGLKGLCIDAAGIAPYAIRCLSMNNCTFESLIAARATSVNIDETIMANPVIEGFNASIHNSWRDIVSWCADGSATVGWRQIGTTTNNINRSVYENLYIIHANGDGMRIHNADTNTYTNLVSYAKGTGRGVKIYGSDINNSEYGRALTFINLQPSNGLGAGTGGLYVQDGTVKSPDRIKVFHYNRENGTPDPIIGTNSEVDFY